jgi:hypothetical protein
MCLSSLFVKIEINGELEERILTLAHVRKMEVKEQIFELIEFALDLEEGYEADKRIPEQV